MTTPSNYTPLQIPAQYEVYCPLCQKQLDGESLVVRVSMLMSHMEQPQVWAIMAHAQCAIDREEQAYRDATENQDLPNPAE